jgi:hypothetical protein
MSKLIIREQYSEYITVTATSNQKTCLRMTGFDTYINETIEEYMEVDLTHDQLCELIAMLVDVKTNANV